MNDKKISGIMHQALDMQETSITFEEIWSSNERLKQNHNKMRRKRRWPIILVASLIIMGTVVGAQQILRLDDITYEFKEDKEVLGTWIVVDFVKEKSQFVPGERQCPYHLYSQAIIFKPRGEVTMVYQDSKAQKPFAESSLQKWTRGAIINAEGKTNSHYWIEEIDNEEYLFYEWKSGDYTFRHLEEPCLYVFKRGELDVAEQNAVENDGKVINTDDINIEFENAEEMLGNWQVVDYVSQIEEFDANHIMMNFYGDGSLSEVFIKEKGMVELVTIEGVHLEEGIKWSGHQIINENHQTVSKCYIKEINGNTYMFYEWKNYDYIYNDQQPKYYVLVKK